MTTLFIILIFAIVVIYDIYLLIAKKQVITAVFRKWYKEKPIVPYMVGIVFIGHFQTLVNISNVPLFIILSAIYLLWCIIMTGTNLQWSRKFYNLNCKIFLIPMALGTIVGTLWR